MGRPRSFDDEAVLDAAIDCFWQRGYEATSVRELAARMGITGASLYNAFGDKRALFGRALQRYVDRFSRRRIAQLSSAPDPVVALEVFFNDLIDASLKDRRGCMLVNSAIEIAPHDAELGVTIQRDLKEIEDGFRRVIMAARRKGAIASHVDAPERARLLLAAVIAIRVLARTAGDRPLLESIARSALAGIEPRAPAHAHC